MNSSRINLVQNNGINKIDYKKKTKFPHWLYDVNYPGLNYRLSDINCSLGYSQLKKINKFIKDSKLKVQSQIQDEQIRVTAKKIDDLQKIISLLKEEKMGLPLQFVNMKK